MNLIALFENKVLIAGLIAWLLAQIIKMPLDYFRTRRWNWALLLTTGGMPSSHSALMTATVFAIGLYHGFDNPLFALGVVRGSIQLPQVGQNSSSTTVAPQLLQTCRAIRAGIVPRP